MNVRRWLNQTVQYQGPGKRDVYGEISYPDPVPIPARFEEKQNFVRTSSGSEVLSTAEVLMQGEPDLQGKIDDRTITARESLVDLGGRVIGWRAYL